MVKGPVGDLSGSQLQLGTTLLVTQSSVGIRSTGQHMTILDSVVPQI
jgi:hypothetical protein